MSAWSTVLYLHGLLRRRTLKSLQPQQKILRKSWSLSNKHFKLPCFKFFDLFTNWLVKSLQPCYSYNHQIRLKFKSNPMFGPLYSMFRDNLMVFKKYLDDYFTKKLIDASSSSASLQSHLIANLKIVYNSI